MKNYFKNSTRIVTLTMAIFFAFATVSCTQSQEKTSTSNAAENSTVATPKIDIYQAVISNNMEAVKGHIAAGTDLNAKDPMGGSTPLILAAVFGRTEIANELIEAGVDLNRTNNDGSTALHTAAFFGRTEIVEALVKTDIDQSIKNNYGSTALESMTVPFEQMKPFYDQLKVSLEPMGFQLDYDQLQEARPVIIKMLQ